MKNDISINEIIPNDYILELLNVVNAAFTTLGFEQNGMSMFYQRISNATSILGIKVCHGDDNEHKNYMLVGCEPTYSNNKIFCNVFLHANKKAALKAERLIPLINHDIIVFFEKVESQLLEMNLIDLKIDFRVPLLYEQEESKAHNNSILRRLFKRKNGLSK